MTDIDTNKLAARVAREQAKRTPRPGSNAMGVIRTNLKAIEALRDQGFTWAAIAAGLAAQGVAHRDGQPLTEKRLTALIDSIRRQSARRLARQDERLRRPDLARAPPRSNGRQSGLAPELMVPVGVPATTPVGEAEEAIRRQQFEATKSLFRNKE